MPFVADLHLHSKFSRATSRDCDLEHLWWWARRKGIAVVGTGDFTHPSWFDELESKLVPAEPGLFRLRADLEGAVAADLGAPPGEPPRFMLQVEISTIYKKGDRTRKVHHLVYAPGFEEARAIRHRLGAIGNISSDGRPILGLDSRDLLEIVLEAGDGCFLVPAHIWTPWFAVLGSKSGFDSIAACYGDLADHVFAAETGLSSDPPMNWRLTSLDRYRLVSNSDAHSPAKLGREASVFSTEVDYHAMRRALETGAGYDGTLEFFPEEGKYHLDGHRKCGVRLMPEETRAHGGQCPACGRSLTVGTMHRVASLADRPEGERPASAAAFRSLVPLTEILGEVQGVGADSKTVRRSYDNLIAKLGPELFVLEHAPLEEVRRLSSSLLADGLARLRRGDVIRQAGFDGEYGRIRLFAQEELTARTTAQSLFEPEPALEPATLPASTPPAPRAQRSGGSTENAPATGSSASLDSEQAAAAHAGSGPLLIIAGPGTGKTRTLTHRIAHLIANGVAPEACVAITFTRRAAEEMRERLAALVPGRAGAVTVATFHGLGLLLMRAHGQPDIRVLSEQAREALVGGKPSEARQRLQDISRVKRAGESPPSALAEVWHAYHEALRAHSAVDFDDLVARSVELLEDASVRDMVRSRWSHVFIDEYQDIDALQYRLIRGLVRPDGELCAIGDPNQAIYGFRGADVSFFLRFQEDFPRARVVRLSRNYRSTRTILDAAQQVIASSNLASGAVDALRVDASKIAIHQLPTDKAEAEYLVHTVEQLLGGHSFFSLDSARASGDADANLSFGDIAVLYRSRAQLPLLVEAFARSGMPFAFRSHERLADQPAIAAMAANLVRGGPPLAQQIETAFEAASVERAEADRLRQALTPLAARCGNDVGHFADELHLATEVDTLDPRADRISLLTLHAAKGLEFPVVFIVGCEDGLLPLRFGPNDPVNEAEERRLFFVGMTRAERHLFLSHADRRLLHGSPRPRQPSPFLADIEEALLERHQAAARRKAKARDLQLDMF
jgi:uncharacterized protein (TIGR00375 family)